MSEFAAKGKTRSSLDLDGGREASLPPLRVRYFRQMKHQRVYTAEVWWPKAAGPHHGQVTVRLLGAGAQILPTEQVLDAAMPDSKATFYVTPLARGWLGNQKLEVLAHGRKIQEIPLASKVVSQRLTWFLLFCTLFVPWFFTEFVKRSPLVDNVRRNAQGTDITKRPSEEVDAYIKDNVPALPAFLSKTPVETGLLETRKAVANGYQQVVAISRIEPIAFYLGVILLCITLISAFLHRAKRGQATGKPLLVAAARHDSEQE